MVLPDITSMYTHFLELSVHIIQLAARCGEAEFNQYVRCSPAQMLAIYIYMKRNAKFHMF